MTTTELPDLMTIEETAAYIGVKTSTLAKWRVSGHGPTFYKLGRVIRYGRNEVKAWIERNRLRKTTH